MDVTENLKFSKAEVDSQLQRIEEIKAKSFQNHTHNSVTESKKEEILKRIGEILDGCSDELKNELGLELDKFSDPSYVANVMLRLQGLLANAIHNFDALESELKNRLGMGGN